MPSLFAALLLLLAACGGPRPAVPDAKGRSVSLLEQPFAELSLPPNNRPDGRAPSERIRLGPWLPLSGARGQQRWQTVLPVRPRGSFLFVPPTGMQILDAQGRPVHPERGASRGEPRWSREEHALDIEAPAAAPPVPDCTWYLTWPKAVAREDALNFGLSGADDPAGFARATIQDGDTSRTGVLIPAPGEAAWDVTVPPDADLRFAPGIVPPEVADGPPSDGVTFSWEIERDGQTTTVWKRHVRPADGFRPVRIDLSAWSGQAVRLRLHTGPGRSAVFDYAFVGDPFLASREVHGHRVVLIFVDTLRRDHMGLYGYDRDTTPHLDAWARDAVVFDDARSVAPWTLPTTRTLLTGRQPELYERSKTVAEDLREAGYATAMFAGNYYLSSSFEINRDWGLHEVQLEPGARTQVDRALAWLRANRGQDTFLLLHFMDAHLPYEEPATYAHRWAGDAPASIGTRFTRDQVLRSRQDAAEKTYIRDRYDQNIRYIDDQLQRLFDVLDDQDTVIFLADHGEEFWDHGGYEHGQSLYDELLRVPLIVEAPGLPPTRVEQPVSLLDVVPTLVHLTGAEPLPTDGVDLGPAMRGDRAAQKALVERDIGFGRLLYGNTQWGTLRGAEKYVTHDGVERLFRVDRDPDEQVDLLKGHPEEAATYRAHLADALGTPVRVGFRMMLDPSRWSSSPLVAKLTVPGGIEAAFAGADPTGQRVADVAVASDTVRVTWPRRQHANAEVFVVPHQPLGEALHGLQAHLESGRLHRDQALDLHIHAGPALGTVSLGGRRLRLDRAVIPLPMKGGSTIEGYDDELSGMLRAMGYAVGPEQDDDGDSGTGDSP